MIGLKSTKLVLLATILTLFSGQLFAQSPYARLGAGYALGTATQTLGTDYDSNNKGTVVNGSLGAGVHINAALGYHFTENLAAELGFTYVLGSSIESKDVSTSQTNTQTLQGRSISFAPALVFSTGFEETVAPYARVGALVALPSFTDERETTGAIQSTYKDRSYGGVAIGFTGALGLQYNISDNLAFFGELQFNALSYKPSKWEIEELTSDGIDILKDLPVSEGTYEDELDAKPATDKKSSYQTPFSSIGFNIGLKATF